MKKLSVLLMMSMLSGCACFDGMCGDDEAAAPAPAQKTEVYRGYNQAQDYRQPNDMYVYNSPRPRPVIIYRRPEPRPIPVYQVEVQETRPAPVYVQTPAPVQTVVAPKTVVVESNNVSSCDLKTTINESTLPDSASPCPAKLKEVREPVEVVYKKTTYKTTYEPKTTSTVTYEKEPYKEIKNTQTVETVTTTTTTTTNPLDVLPADEIK